MTQSLRAISPGRWLRLIFLLVAEAIGSRFRRSRAGTLIAVVEPLGVIGLFTLTHYLSVPHRPQFGTSFALFYATGVLPFYLFFHVAWRLRAWDNLVRLPFITEFDLLLVQILAELTAKIAVIVLFDLALWAWGVPDALPRDPLVCLGALLFLAMLGAGWGIINAVIGAFFPLWLYAYGLLTRVMMAFSGVLFVVDQMPLGIRTVAAWIPITHGVTLYRSGHYTAYPTLSLDLTYMLGIGIAIIALAWILQSSTREFRPTR